MEDAVEYVLHACEGVAQAHAAGIVHRDLKPSNLFLTARADGSPCVKVLDFGIAKALDLDEGDEEPSLTGSRSLLGSPTYMSPEQIRSAKTVDHRTDVWALGLILFELLTAQRPFTGGSVASRLAATAADAPIRLRSLRRDAPAALEDVVLRCLEKDVARRTPSVAALARELAPFAPARAVSSIERAEASLRGALAPAARDPQSRTLGTRARVVGGALAVVLAGTAAAYRVAATTAPRSAAAPSAPEPIAAATGATPAPPARAEPASTRPAEAAAEPTRAEAALGHANRTPVVRITRGAASATAATVTVAPAAAPPVVTAPAPRAAAAPKTSIFDERN